MTVVARKVSSESSQTQQLARIYCYTNDLSVTLVIRTVAHKSHPTQEPCPQTNFITMSLTRMSPGDHPTSF